MRILFVCKHNVFRSQLSLAYFNKINKNKNIIADSAGIFQGKRQSPNQKKAAYDILGVRPKIQPKTISTEMLRKTDLVIISARNVPRTLFSTAPYVKKVIKWKLYDVLDDDYYKARKTIIKIKKHVDLLAKHLKDSK